MSNLLSHQEARVLHLTLNRPEKRNAFDADLCRALVDALDAANHDPSVGAILLTANGPTFCAGMDLTEIEASPDTDEIGQLHEQLFTAGARLARPLVAAVHGPALGGGTGLVANAHIVVAAPQATFGLTEIRLGLWPFLVYRAVEAALGNRRTLELALTGRLFPAAEARDYALVHEIADNPADRAREIALALAAASPTAIQAGLQFVHRSCPLPSDQAGALAQQMRNHVFSGDDFREGLRAFREKRAPQWPSIRQEHPE
jgi:enoyl-CoA hydratase/carnithine racemase